MDRRHYLLASVCLVAPLVAPLAARAQGAPALQSVATSRPATPPPPTDALPGSPLPPGLGLAPEAPPVPPAPGGRAPSFGAPSGERASAFRIGGRIFGWQAVGIGEAPSNPPPGYSGRPLHIPMRAVGRIPFWGGAGATLNLQYGTKYVTAFASYNFGLNRPEYQGFGNPQLGPNFLLANLTITPDPIDSLRLQIRVGALVENYAGPGQWGWGIYGPLLALRGFGETTNGEWDFTRDIRLNATHGVLAVPGVAESFARGDYNSWIETGVSTWVHHAHFGATIENKYILRLHYASARGTDDRRYLLTFLGQPPRDGRFDAYLAEARWQADPWGQLGVSGGLYDFRHAASVGDGIWWAVDWTQGAREMINKFLGPLSNGNGKLAVVGAEYTFSVSRILWHPRSFTGQGPDLRVSIAGMLTRTVASDDANYEGAMGYFAAVDAEYRMTPMFGVTMQAYAERRDSHFGPWAAHSINPGISIRTDWLSLDRFQLIYGRRFYSSVADFNASQPLDRHMVAIGGHITF